MQAGASRRRGDAETGATAMPRVVGDGLASGAGIALQYLALAQAGPAAGIWPVTAGRITAILAVVVLTAMFRSRPAADATRRPGARTTMLTAALAGALAGLALVCYMLATRTEMITLSVVLSSLYPVIPVLLGITLLHERLTPTDRRTGRRVRCNPADRDILIDETVGRTHSKLHRSDRR